MFTHNLCLRCAISQILQDWSGFDLDLATKYIVESQSYDGGIGMGPGTEGHGTRLPNIHGNIW